MPVKKISLLIGLVFLLINPAFSQVQPVPSYFSTEGAYNPETPAPAASQSSAAVWTRLPDAIEPRVEGHSAFIDGKIYVFGGFQTENIVPTDQNEVYDLATNTWSTFAPLPVPNTHVGSAEADGKVWIAGGFALIGFIQTVDFVWIYDPVTDTFEDGPSLPAPRAGGALVRLGRKLHYISGLINRNDNTGDHFVLDLDEPGGPQTWTMAAPMPDPRDHFSAVAVGGKIYAIGGQFGHDIDPVDTDLIHEYDPVTDSWTRKADLPYIRSHFEPGTVVVDGKIIIAGGRTGTQNCVDDITQYDPVTNTWTEVFAMPYCALAPSLKVVDEEMYLSHGGVISVLHPTTEANKTDFPRTLSSEMAFTPVSYTTTMAPNETEEIEPVLWTLSNAANYSINLAGLPSWISGVSKSAGTADTSGDEIDIVLNTTGLAPGVYTHTLTATAAGYDNATFTVQLTVSGDGIPQLTFTPSAIDLGVVPAGQTHTQTITLANEGSGTATFDLTGINTTNLEVTYDGVPVEVMLQPEDAVLQLAPGESVDVDFYITLLAGGAVSGTANYPYFSDGTETAVSLTFNATGTGARIARINTGGSAISPGVFDEWTSDQYFEGGSTFSNPDIEFILGTLDQEPYKSERSAGTNLGSFAYRIPVPVQGHFITRLHFAETYFGAPGGTIDFVGRRVFDVNIEGGALELDDYDIAAEVGPITAVVKSFNTEVNDGVLDIEFTASADQPKVSGIEVFQVDQVSHQSLVSGWNMVGLPVVPASNTPASIYTDVNLISPPYAYEGSAYADKTTMEMGVGYWIKTDGPGIQLFTGTEDLSLSYTLNAGWNMISGPSCSFDLEDATGDTQILPTVVYGFNASGGYFAATVLQAGQGYWIEASAAGSVVFDCGAGKNASAKLTSRSAPANQSMGSLLTLQIQDATGITRDLYIGEGADEDYVLPPTPPRAIADVRFLNSSSLMTTDEALAKLQGMEAPLTLSLEGNDASQLNVLVQDGDGWRVVSTLSAGQEVVLNEPALDRLLISKDAERAAALPDAFTLQGAYPNPFQSDVSISFDAPEDGTAHIEVYDVLGKRVLQTKAEAIAAGAQRAISVDGHSLAAGTYLYRIVLETAAGTQTASGRVVLVK